MESKDWAVIIVAFVAPLVAAGVAFGLNRAEQNRRSIRQLFYGLKRHVDEFKYALYSLVAHSNNHEINARIEAEIFKAGAVPTSELFGIKKQVSHDMWAQHNQESIRIIASARIALSKLNADKSLLKMHYTTELAKPLVDSLDELTELATEFLPTQEGGRTPEYDKVKTLPIDATVEQVHKKIDLLWIDTIYPLGFNDF